MEITMIKPTTAYIFLPKQKNLTKTRLIKEMKENIDKNSEDEEIKNYQKELMFRISYKLLSEEWSMEDYYEFLQAINQNIVKCYPQESFPAIIHLFNYSDEELKYEVEKIKEETKNMRTPMYPYSELVTTEDKKQVPKTLDYNKMHPYKMVGTIISRIYGHQADEVKKLFTEENHEIILELLKEVCSGKRDATPFFNSFDQAFGFLRDLDAYKELYFYGRANYLKMLESDFAHRYRLKQTTLLKYELAYDINERANIKYNLLPQLGGYFKHIKKK